MNNLDKKLSQAEELLIELFSSGVQCWVEAENIIIDSSNNDKVKKYKSKIKHYEVEIKKILYQHKIFKKTYPLSQNQLGIWFHNKLYGNSDCYNMGGICLLKGDFIWEYLSLAYKKLFAENSVLRCYFREFASVVFAEVADYEGNLGFVNAENWENKEIENYISHRFNRNISFKEKDIFRCVAMQLSINSLSFINARFQDTVHKESSGECPFYSYINFPKNKINSKSLNKNSVITVMIFDSHHIIMDFISFREILKQLSENYHNIKNKAPLSIEDIEIKERLNFMNYATEENLWLLSKSALRQKKYWKSKLANIANSKPKYSIPLDKEKDKFTEKRIKLSNHLRHKIKHLAQFYGVTPFVGVLTALQLTAQCYYASSDINIAIPVSGRRKKWQQCIGYFANVVLLRQSINDFSSLKELLINNKSILFEAMKNQALPFPIARQSNDKLNGQRLDSFINLAFTWDVANIKNQNEYLENFELIHVEQKGTIYDLVVTMHINEDHWVLSFCYNESKIGENIVNFFQKKMITNMEKITSSINKEILLKDFLKTTPPPWYKAKFSQKKYINKIKIKDNDFTISNGNNFFIIKKILNIGERYPDKTAIIFNEKSIKYREIIKKIEVYISNLLKYIEKNQAVAIILDRGEEQIISMLALLWLGIPYIPLDRKKSKELLITTLFHSKPQIVICESEDTQWFCDNIGLESTKAISIKRISSETHRHFNNTNLIHSYKSPHHNTTAYIIYTSGSTGKPKGVNVSHENLNCLFKSTENFFIEKDQVWGAFHNSSFDFSVWEMWGPLIHGKTLYIFSEQEVNSPYKLHEAIINNKISHLNMTPPAFQLLLPTLLKKPSNALNLRCLILGGAPLSKSLGLQSLALNIPIWNFYGPTETTVWASYSQVTNAKITIGKPLPSVGAYVLDENLEWVAEGCIGELYLSGGQVANYFLNPIQSAKNFIPDIYGNALRMYKTGDLVSYDRDAGLTYIGRKDRQVKYRGYRLELEEVETLLETHPKIHRAVCILPQDSILSAFYQCEPLEDTDKKQLEAILENLLPTYCLPIKMININEIPRNSNEKVDYPALYKYFFDKVRNKKIESQYSNNIYRREIESIWQQELNTNINIGKENFFELGGTSLNLMNVYYRLINELQLDIGLSDLYFYQTLDELSSFLATGNKENNNYDVTIENNSKIKKRRERLKNKVGEI